MLDFSYCAPTFYEFGENAECEVVSLIKKYKGSRVLIHYGGGSVVKSGLLDRVKKILDDSGIFYIELGGVKANPESDLVYEGIRVCRENNIDFILAVGGGSVIDSSKAIGVGFLYDGDFWDFFDGKNRKEIVSTIPVGVILTIAAAGSEGSPSMVITNSKTKMKRGNLKSDIVRPVFAIMNPRLTMTLSKYQIACGIVDIIVHVIERYFSNTKDCIVTNKMCEAILSSMLVEGKKVIDNPDDYAARANIMWASTIAHNNICGVGREQDWASHKIEHELSGLYGIAHGAGLSVIVIRWMRYVSKINNYKFIDFGNNVLNMDRELYDSDVVFVNEVINRLEDFFVSLGMPSSLEELGYKEDVRRGLTSRIIEIRYVNNNFGKMISINIPSFMNKSQYDNLCFLNDMIEEFRKSTNSDIVVNVSNNGFNPITCMVDSNPIFWDRGENNLLDAIRYYKEYIGDINLNVFPSNEEILDLNGKKNKF